MQLQNYYHSENDTIRFSRQQASDFAKNIAGDFNPIHNIDAKRFCVPGDLLFAVALHRYGLSQKMRFTFSGMVTDEAVIFPDGASDNIAINDTNGKQYLTIERNGEKSHDPTLLSELTRNYVAFSGQTFPHILVPLMKKNGVMINPERPLVIYESMEINIDSLDAAAPTLELSRSHLEVEGKRGSATLEFKLISHGKTVGHGAKSMVLSGLREFDAAQISALVSEYETWKQNHLNT